MEQPLAVNAENSRAKVQNVGGDSAAGWRAELLLSSGGLIEQGAISRTFNPTESTGPNSTTALGIRVATVSVFDG